MKHFYLLLLCISGLASAQIVNIPDANFKAKLISLGVDTNADGEIQVSEAENVTNLQIYDSSISDLTGIEAFINIENLAAGDNNLMQLSLIDLPNLQYATLSQNLLTELTLSNLPQLRDLSLGHNNLSAIDLDGAPALENLHIDYNNLTTIDLAATPLMRFLTIQNNQLTSIDASSLVQLEELFASDNQITSVAMPPVFHFLRLINNPIAAVDLSSSVFSFLDLSFEETLEFVNVKNAGAGTVAFWPGDASPFLYICADEPEIAQIQTQIDINGFPESTSVGSYCSFVPGGNYNTITGTIKFDQDGNGCDASDPIISNARISVDDGPMSGAVFSGETGNYSVYTDSGNITVAPDVENPAFFTITPPTVSVPFVGLGQTQTQNFCLTANGVHPDVEVILWPNISASPGFDASYFVTLRNKGNQVLSGTVTAGFDDTLLDFVSASPPVNTQAGGTLSWDYSNLAPFETETFSFTVNVNGPMETPPVNIDDVLIFTASASSDLNDEFPADNDFLLNQTVIGSFDPNDKTCLEGAVVSPERIGDYLHYLIRFENTGTAPATNIVVKDVIDIAQYDVSSLQVMASSHPALTRITGNIVEFIFEGINLPFDDAQNDGYVLFKIKSKASLTTGSSVSNRAEIFFDYNFPIVTNDATTTFQTLGVGNPGYDQSVKIYPNPAIDFVNIDADSEIKSVQLFDVQGRLLSVQLPDSNVSSIELSEQQSGIFIVKIITQSGMKVEKIIKK